MAEERGPGTIDVRQIMEEIRRRVAEKKAAGLYTEGEIEEISRMELSLQEHQGFGEEMDSLISWLHAHWEATGPVDIAPRVLRRPWREAVKKFLRLLLRPEAKLLLAKQNQINARTVQLLSGALPPLRDGHRDVEQRLENLASRLEKENLRLREKLDELSARLERLEGGEEQGPPGRSEKR